MVIALIALLGTAAIVMDVGFAWYAKRQVQASADAAALAGAQALPDTSAATQLVNDYAARNLPDNLQNVVVDGGGTPTYSCTTPSTTAGWCGPGKSYQFNKISVNIAAESPSWFARVLGINHFNVKGTATACQPCASSPVDIELVLDRTGSMCQPKQNGLCTDLNNAKLGVQTLLGIMDPNIDTIGMVAFPPYGSGNGEGVCGSTGTPSLTINGKSGVAGGSYDNSALIYGNDVLSNDFKANAQSALNPSSSLVKHVQTDYSSNNSCPIKSFGSTSYDDALKAGQAELTLHGRPGVPKIIVFMTDGEANEGSYFGPTVANHMLEPDLDDPTTNFNMSPAGSASTANPGDAQPCHSAINAATTIKASGTIIYTIGYDLFDQTTGYAYCVHGVWGQIDKSLASSSTDYANFQCRAIGSPLLNTGKNLQSWQTTLTAGHYQPIYPPQPPDKNNTNPCTNAITGDHREVPNITSYTTLQTIATPGNFYNKPKAGDMTSIFAAIAADITKGTSRLIDDSY